MRLLFGQKTCALCSKSDPLDSLTSFFALQDVFGRFQTARGGTED